MGLTARKGRSCVPAGVALLCTAGTLSCTQILGLRERPVADNGGQNDTAGTEGDAQSATVLTSQQCGAIEQPPESCASCMNQKCCAAATACAGDRACLEASNCLAGCNDSQCSAACQVFYAQPETLVDLRACRVQQCASECDSSCGEFVSAASSCQTCMQTSCCSQGTACASDTNCAALNLCISNCFGAAPCVNSCLGTYPLGMTDYENWVGCTNQCATPCQPGQSWACLQSATLWPGPPTVGMVTFSVTFVNFTAAAPFVGTAVKACSKLDYTCTSPLASATADSTGLVTLTVPTGTTGFDGYLEVTGGQDDTGAAVFPALWYPVPFVVADGWRGQTTLPATDELQTIIGATGTTIDPTRGSIAMNAVDCAFTPAAGVSFTAVPIDSKTVSYYLVGGVPVTTATQTDQSGIGAFANVPTTSPAGLTVVSAISTTAGGKSLGSLSFVVRPGMLTTSSSFPPIP